jgi:hypothetical protein
VLLGRVGLEASRWLAQSWLVTVSGDWRSYRQQYVPFNGAVGGRISVDENRFDLGGTVGFDLGGLLAADGRVEVMPLVGGQVLTARNSGFAFEIVGPTAGLRASWSFAPFTVRAIGTYTYNVAKDSSGPSAFRSPVAAIGGRAGLQFRLTSMYALELDYVGNGIRFENVWRVGHGAAMGFSTSF